ncbi:MAG: inositol monophosphatase [Ruminococcaceae bacterium]|nr:inositol monophosphatase [Oscillospiraceae bacterium]
MDMQKLLAGIEAAARGAGRIMLEADDVRSVVTEKEGHGNFVTAYDKRVQAYLFAELARVLPEAKFIGEEDGADAFTDDDRRGFAFCVDPIDGTTNFLTGYRPSVTSIALLHDGKPLLGVVYNPYADMMFSAVRGGGAALNGAPIRSSEEPLARSVVSFGTAPYYPELAQRTFAVCADYLPRCIDLRRSGTAAWDLCCCAMGATGLYYELELQLWDYAAAGLIAEEAGCRVTGLGGSPLPWDGPSSVICASAGVAREDYFPRVSLSPPDACGGAASP